MLGNIVNWEKISKIVKKRKILLIEDSADTIGATYKKKSTGYKADISITSFYGSHIINCAGNGGMVCFNNKEQYIKAKLLRSWGRSSSLYDEKSEKIVDSLDKEEDIVKRMDYEIELEALKYVLEKFRNELREKIKAYMTGNLWESR